MRLQRSVWPMLLVAVSAPAHADAFLEPVGAAKLIVAARFEHSDRAWDASGKLRPVAAYRKFTLSANAEYGVADDLTLVIRADGGFSRGDGDAQTGSLGLGARYALWRGADTIVSAEAFTAAGADADAPPGARSAAFADARLAVGRSFEIAGRQAFATLSAGERVTSGRSERRLDATLGFRLTETVLLLAQSFNRWSSGGERRGHKMQASAVWSVTPVWSIQAGLYASAAGRAQGRQQGGLLAVWRRF